MSLVVWAIAFGLLGILMWLAGGVVFAPMLPGRLQDRVANWYFTQSAAAAWRPLFVGHSAGFELCASEFDGERLAESVSPFGKSLDFDDSANLMGRWHGRPAGTVEVGVNAVTTPLHAYIGARDQDLYRAGDTTVRVPQESGGEVSTVELQRADVPVEEGLQTVDVTRWNKSTAHSTQPSDADTTARYAYLSQLGFNTRSTVEVIMLLMAFGVGIGAVWLVTKFGGVTNSVNLPLVLEVML